VTTIQTARVGRSPLPLAAAAFVRKEASDVLRQPLLLVTLVLGPFLILLGFGLGYRNEVRPFRTVFVGQPQATLTREIESSADRLGSLIKVEDVTTDEASARRRLVHGDVDAVVVLPDEPLSTVIGGHRAVLRILHNRLDPVELTVIRFAARLAVAQVNAAVLADIVSEGQSADAPVSALLSAADATVGRALRDVDAGDLAAADREAAAVSEQLRRLETGALTLESLLGRVDQSTSPSSDLAAAAGALEDVLQRSRSSLATARAHLDAARSPQARAALVEAQQTLGDAPRLAKQLLDVDADVLVQPFEGQLESLAPTPRTFTDYYAPAAIVLLLQQFGVAFAALSFVRERQLGATELYRVSPVTARQIVAGKYLGHFAIGALVAVALTALSTTILDVPLAGQISDLAVTLGLVVLASIGLGFLISLSSPSDLQAVLLTMLVLLAALFFSGFFLSTEQLVPVARAASWVLPATYGIELARAVMLRGDGLDARVAGGLAAYGIVLAVVVGLLAARHLSTRR
jgi:ABC-2 type transport system permease protein